MKLYHGTYKKTLPSILTHGLQISHSGVHGYDHEACVFLGTEEQATQVARCLARDAVVLTIELDKEFTATLTEHPKLFGIVSLRDIPASCIVSWRSAYGTAEHRVKLASLNAGVQATIETGCRRARTTDATTEA